MPTKAYVLLISGLGAGISATAFNRHEISTTIVEVDPAVYNAARRYFGVPDPGPGRVFLEDARSWVSRREKTGALFDFVVHDCFSGGGVPEHIYTLEFWNDLNTLVEPEGTVVVVGRKLFDRPPVTLTLDRIMLASSNRNHRG
jgi:spermidine synthase